MEKGSIKKQVYFELKKNIMSLRFAPGQTISTKELAAKLNVSITPVREALLQLQEEDLVVMIPQRETIVSKISLTQIEQEKFIRECLELGVVEKFLRKGQDAESETPKVISRMRALIKEQQECVQNQDYVGFVEADDCFHKVLFDETGQQMAWDAIASRNGHYNRFRILYVQGKDVSDSSVAQHGDIITLLERGEKEALRHALQQHIQRIDLQSTEPIRLYPDYFTEQDYGTSGFEIGTL